MNLHLIAATAHGSFWHEAAVSAAR